MTDDEIKAATLPVDLNGKSVLDVGGYTGYWAAESCKRGAVQTVVVDNSQWRFYTEGGWGRPVSSLPGVCYFRMDVMEYRQPADIVLCFNVVYHVKAPWLFLEHLRRLTRETLAICSFHVEPGGPQEMPKGGYWRVYEPHEAHGNPSTAATCYWRPSLEGLQKLLRAVGFKTQEVISGEPRIALRAS